MCSAVSYGRINVKLCTGNYNNAFRKPRKHQSGSDPVIRHEVLKVTKITMYNMKRELKYSNESCCHL
jgi:hypothetical protein